MNPKHQEKIKELVEIFASNLIVVCERLYRSGGIAVEDYSTEDFALAKILLSAAIEQQKRAYYPHSPENRKEVKNLINF